MNLTLYTVKAAGISSRWPNYLRTAEVVVKLYPGLSFNWIGLDGTTVCSIIRMDYSLIHKSPGLTE